MSAASFTVHGKPLAWQRVVTRSLLFTIPGKPVPKARARKGAGDRWFTPKPTREYEKSVGWHALTARTIYQQDRQVRRDPSPRWPLDARYSVDVLATFGDARPRDLDNLLKSLCDGGNGVLWNDDSQIDEKTIRRAPPSRAPHVVIRVTVLEALRAPAEVA